MEPERFRPLLTAQGPFVSVYIDDSGNSADTMARREAIWSDLHKHLESQGADGDIIDRLERAVLHGQPGVGSEGRAIIATHGGVLIDEHLSSPPAATELRISEYPYILPLVKDGVRRPVYVFAAVDHEGADVTLHRGGAVTSETVDGGGYPVHKPASAGWNGYGDVGHSAEEAVRMNVRAVADRVTELVDETGAEVVFVCGEVRSRTDVVSALPPRVATRAVQFHAGAQGHRVRQSEVQDLVDTEFDRRRRCGTADIAERFRSEHGRASGLAAEGIAAVCAALREGDVATLIVADLHDATVVTGENRATVAPDADVLSELGEAAHQVVRADEALPFAAVAVGADLVCVDDLIAPVDGIAALLRYVPADIVV
ncbi:Rv2629 family ribosome hibernation factor [Mycolicibacterium stellerae]|uniref:Rv2629 family ribosome hibernation factor n=1 Tax=Mycolicibacterium stellerae TaxID=2358193 RepID=UPI000F0AF9C8|nr:hypothetical protein [Mycolicibacterium stellerae]